LQIHTTQQLAVDNMSNRNKKMTVLEALEHIFDHNSEIEESV